MAASPDIFSIAAGAAGSLAGSAAQIISSGNARKAAEAQADAQKYMAGEMTEQEYLRRVTAQENNLSGITGSILEGKQKTDYLPYIAIGGAILLAAVVAIKKNK